MRKNEQLIPTSYEQALDRLTGYYAGSPRALGGNVSVTMRPSDHVIALRLYATEIVTFYADGSIGLNTGGYRTSTTKAKMNAALRKTGFAVAQKDGEWYVESRDGVRVAYRDGMTLTPTRSLFAQVAP